MAGATYSNHVPIKSLWPQKAMYEQLFDDGPLLGLIKKSTNFSEKYRYIAVGYGAPQGIAGTFTEAKTYKTASKAKEFAVQTRSYYATFSLEGKLYRAAKEANDRAFIVNPMKRESMQIMQETRNNLGRYLHGDGVGVLGRLTSGSNVASTSVTLQTASTIRHFSVGMPIQLESTGATGGTVRSGYHVISAVGTLASPTLTFATSLDTGIPAAAASDYVYRAGTYDTAPILGLEAWNPAHGGTPSAFLGVTRTDHADRLAGLEYDASQTGPYQRIVRAARLVTEQGFRPNVYFMSTRNWENLQNEQLDAKRLNYTKAPAAPINGIKLGIEYRGIEIMGPRGPISVYADHWMDDTVERCGQLDTLCLASLGNLLNWQDGASPGQPMLEDSADSHEVRLVGDMAFYNEAPAAWCRVTVA